MAMMVTTNTIQYLVDDSFLVDPLEAEAAPPTAAGHPTLMMSQGNGCSRTGDVRGYGDADVHITQESVGIVVLMHRMHLIMHTHHCSRDPGHV